MRIRFINQLGSNFGALIQKLKVILDQKGIVAIEEQGTHVTDIDGDLVTLTVNGGE